MVYLHKYKICILVQDGLVPPGHPGLLLVGHGIDSLQL